MDLPVVIPAVLLSSLVLSKTAVGLLLLAVLLVKFRRPLYIVLATLPRDFKFLQKLVQVVVRMKRFKRQNSTIVSLFTERALKAPDRPCIFFEDQTWTCREMDEYSNQLANVFYDAGFHRGDTIALCMDNRPEYVCIWLGLAKIGVVTALINSNLRLQPLVHSLQVAKPKAIVFCAPFVTAFKDISNTLDKNIVMYQLEPLNDTTVDGLKVVSLSPLLETAPTSPPKINKQPDYNDKLLYIYTSGTTGMPKAAVIPHSRYLFVTVAMVSILDLRKNDVLYNPLPLYHTAGGVMGVGPALIGELPVVLKKKFSASSYWKDCIKYKCTISQYIGEMCRYILSVPPMPEDQQHHVRMMVGNGMRPAIWSQFVHRFKIGCIAELYGATEGNANIINLDNTIGAIGALPRYIPWSICRMGLIRVDSETGTPLRDKNGLCIKCEVDEPGMFVGIISSHDVTREYHGYVDKEASNRKVIQNVFSKGDQAFLSGDILVMDKFGYLFFKDRTGDTFRWKGENVATAEVETVIGSSDAIGLKVATVYGVEIPGQEGRAGMVAIADPDGSLDLNVLASGVDQGLASYARPIFVRIVKDMDLTGTYKIRKVDLQKEGFNPYTIKDRLYVRQGTTYVPITKDLYEDIITGKVRV